MTKKIRENLLILLISNIITIILFVTAPYIIRVVTSTNATENNNLMLSPLPILLYLILLSLLVCIITVLYRLHTEKRIIINNSITPYNLLLQKRIKQRLCVRFIKINRTIWRLTDMRQSRSIHILFFHLT